LFGKKLLVCYGELGPGVEDLAGLGAGAALELRFYGPWEGRAAVAF
jgi:hypothetical protein